VPTQILHINDYLLIDTYKPNKIKIDVNKMRTRHEDRHVFTDDSLCALSGPWTGRPVLPVSERQAVRRLSDFNIIDSAIHYLITMTI